MKRAIEILRSRVRDGADEAWQVPSRNVHELDTRKTDSGRGDGASRGYDCVEAMRTHHYRAALENRAASGQLTDRSDLLRSVAHGRVGEGGDARRREIAAEDARPRLQLGGGHARHPRAQPLLHSDQEA